MHIVGAPRSARASTLSFARAASARSRSRHVLGILLFALISFSVCGKVVEFPTLRIR